MLNSFCWWGFVERLLLLMILLELGWFGPSAEATKENGRIVGEASIICLQQVHTGNDWLWITCCTTNSLETPCWDRHWCRMKYWQTIIWGLCHNWTLRYIYKPYPVTWQVLHEFSAVIATIYLAFCLLWDDLIKQYKRRELRRPCWEQVQQQLTFKRTVRQVVIWCHLQGLVTKGSKIYLNIF